ncbi:MAG: MBL fold metallo-hydrolase [Archaeoglobus sp.]|nr:MBL fold metallo-hydrolase [Archaeoglobus sp.]
MRVVAVGSGTAVPSEGRSQSCYMIEKDGRKILVDAGMGTLLRLDQLDVDVREIEAILLTHNHLDHNGDLLGILKARWLNGSEDELSVFGPKGTKYCIEALLEAYSYLRSKLNFSVKEGEEEFEVAGFEVMAIPTFHSVRSNGYLIDGKVLISGDTRPFKEFFEVDCDLLIHELSLPFGYETQDHTTPENLKEMLDVTKAEKIVLTHLYPQTLEVKDEILRFLDDPRLSVANDGDSWEV